MRALSAAAPQEGAALPVPGIRGALGGRVSPPPPKPGSGGGVHSSRPAPAVLRVASPLISGHPCEGPWPSNLEERNLELRKVQNLDSGSCAHRLPRRTCGGVGGAFPPLGQESCLLSPQRGDANCLCVPAGLGSAGGWPRQVLLSPPVTDGEGEARSGGLGGPRRTGSRCSGPKSCAFSSHCPASTTHVGLRIVDGLRSPTAPTWALG